MNIETHFMHTQHSICCNTITFKEDQLYIFEFYYLNQDDKEMESTNELFLFNAIKIVYL